MKIFEYSNCSLSLNMPEILLVPAFKAIVDLDKSKKKTQAFKMFTYAYLLCDFRSPYKDYNLEDKIEEAKQACGLNIRTIESDVMQTLIKTYDELLNANRMLTMIKSMYKSIDELCVYFQTINFEEKVESGARKGTHLYSPTELIKVVKEAKFLIDTLKTLEEQVKEELSEEVKTRGDQELGWIAQR